MSRVYAIGDIHGHLDKLQDAHRKIAEDLAQNPDDYVVVHVGDLIDRGPDSAGVIGWLMAGLDRGQPWLVLKGNHDRMMSYFLQTPSKRDERLRSEHTWLHPALGGQTTLESYGVDVAGRDVKAVHKDAQVLVPVEHRQFLLELDTVYSTPAVLFVHAGIRPGIPMTEQTEEDLVWIRAEFHNDTRDYGQLIVHGHTPIATATHYGNRLNIDSGAAFGRHLTVVVIDGLSVWDLTDNGRLPLKPQGRA